MSLRQLILLVIPTDRNVSAIITGITALSIVIGVVVLTCTVPLASANSTCHLSINLVGIFSLFNFVFIVRYRPTVAFVAGLVYLAAAAYTDEHTAVAIATWLKAWL